ncbi:MAG: cytochrome c biogenesis protein CcsA [Akkermansiaceae bacterium]|nr:cytochrome c biogenesis protein CcsA [Akkermansiaceae bacterium]
MERWLLLASTLLALIVAVQGIIAVNRGRRSRWTLSLMVLVIACQSVFLALRGEVREACPLADLGEILAFLAWSLTLFYLLIGPAYRISLLGVFTAPVVVIFQAVALIPGVMTANPEALTGGNPWHETHSATSVLAYGAYALAGVAGVMFLVLDKQLKDHHLKSGLFKNLPPVRELIFSLTKLLWLGTALLTIGIVAGILMPKDGALGAHFVTAIGVWVAYIALLIIKQVRGMTGRKLSRFAVILFVLSLAVFAFI